MGDEIINTFRDKISTTNDSGRREWVYPNKPKGKYYHYRSWVSVILLILYFAAPFIKIKGNPLILIDLINRKFFLFGKVYWPQDFHLFVFAMIALIVGIVLFTVIFGRVWCGWACPQTVFMEMVFRKIEYLIEGNANKQKKLDRSPFSIEKAWKKGLKHLIFIIISISISVIFVSYFIDNGEYFPMFASGEIYSGKLMVVLFALSGWTYFVFAKFREQACTLVCPYGRLQGVLLDSDSLVVAYNYNRGEKRGTWRRGENRSQVGKGDCVDCGNCVKVCPTGIDIRNGTQLECINCMACIDACNRVMDKFRLPKGLISITSENKIRAKKRSNFNARAIAYLSLFLVLVSFTIILFVTRNDIETTILKAPGSTFQSIGTSKISNLYNYTAINKTGDTKQLKFDLLFPKNGTIKFIGKEETTLNPSEKVDGLFLIIIENKDFESTNIPIEIGVYSDGEMIEEISSNFIVPKQNR